MVDQEPQTPHNGVRISNPEIYRLLLETNALVRSVEQTVRDVLRPGLESQAQQTVRLAKDKADAEELQGLRTRLEKVEMRMYAIVSGLVAAVIGGKGLGFF